MTAHDYAVEAQLDTALTELVGEFMHCQDRGPAGRYNVRLRDGLVEELKRLWTERHQALARDRQVTA